MSIHNSIDGKKTHDLNEALRGVGGRHDPAEMRKGVDGIVMR
jgi:hypothetical protein